VPVGSGKMRHRLTIFAPEGTYGTGDPSPAVEIATGIGAAIIPLPLQFQQAERIAAGGTRGQVVYNIFLRYRGDLQANFELHEECCNERTFHIVSMLQDDKMEWWELTCQVAT
jgi:head-tail adaptor